MQNPFDQFDAPTKSGPILGPAPRVDPYKARDQQLQEEAAARAREDQALQMRKFEVDQQKAALDMQKTQRDLMPGADTTEGEKTAGFLATRVAGGIKELQRVTQKDPSAAAPTFGVETVRSIFGDTAANYFTDAERQQVVAAQTDILDAALTLGTGAAYTAEQLDGYRRSYFPQLGDDDATVKAKQQRLVQLLESAKVKAGRSAPMIDEALAAVGGQKQDFGITVDPNLAVGGVITNPAPNTPRPTDPYQGVRRPEMRGGLAVGTDVTFQDQADGGIDRADILLKTQGLTVNAEANLVAKLNANSGNQNITAQDIAQFYAETGSKNAPPSMAEFEKMAELLREGRKFGPLDTSAAEAEYRAKLEEAAKLQGEPGYGTRVETGITYGLSDEAAGVGGAISSLLRGDNVVDGYTFARDVERERQKQADANTGFSGDVVEIGSSLLIPGGAAKTPLQAAKAGATFGAIGGFGYGEGAKGSTVNALLGAGAGAGLGAGISKGISAASNRIASRAANKQAQNALAQAATDEGAILNKAMADPSLMAKTRAVSSTMTGAPIVQKGMAQAGDSIQNALATNVGKSGQVLERPNAGSAMQGAFQRADKNKKSNVDRLYDAYQKASGDPAIVPNDAIAALDNQLVKLKRSPDTHEAEIADLEGLRADLTNGNVTVEALRNIRTAKREAFKANNLSFSQRETRMMDILDAANNDIAKGLDPTSPGYALLQRANKAHQERVVFKKQLMADLIGKDRDLPTDPGKAFETILNWTNPRGDLRKLEALKRASTTDEWKDFGATVIDSFAKDKSGNFSTTALVASIERLNKAGPKTIETLFGKDGAKSLKNIELLAREHKRVMNGIAGQGSAQGNDFRSWLFTALLPAGAGAGYASGSTTTGLAAGATAVTAKVARDFLTAKSVMSPKITGWLRATPKTTSPAVINAHFNKLTAIAKAEPALANDIDALRELILQAANDNANKAVAEDRKSEGMR